MIVFQLRCAAEHQFEAWFRDGAAYEAQAASASVTCPICGDTTVSKAPMAPRIAKSRDGDDKRRLAEAEVLKQLGALRKAVEENADYVGDSFAEEARRIHYGETDARNIYGEATADQAEELREEGVAFARVPWLPRTNS